MSRMRNSNRDRFQRLTYLRNIRTAGEVYEKLESENISPVLIKGLAAAINYPNPFQRAFSDIDLAVEPGSFDAAAQVIAAGKYTVDLHKGLRHLDTKNWRLLFEDSRIVEIEGVAIRVLCPEDHLRVLCVHWLNDGGADRTRLWDIYFALKSAGDDFDWQRFFSPVNEKRRRWLTLVLLIVKHYLGLDIENEKFEDGACDLPRWVVAEIEKEWRNDTRLVPLNRVLGDRRQLYEQISKRIPPNALQALIETDGAIGAELSYLPRVRNFVERASPSIRRILKKEKQ